MTSILRDQLLAKYPDYMKLPLHLSEDELNSPHTVISAFFDTYHLEQARVLLISVRNTALQAGEEGECNAWEVVYFTDRMLKLVEAVSLLRLT